MADRKEGCDVRGVQYPSRANGIIGRLGRSSPGMGELTDHKNIAEWLFRDECGAAVSAKSSVIGDIGWNKSGLYRGIERSQVPSCDSDNLQSIRSPRRPISFRLVCDLTASEGLSVQRVLSGAKSEIAWSTLGTETGLAGTVEASGMEHEPSPTSPPTCATETGLHGDVRGNARAVKSVVPLSVVP